MNNKSLQECSIHSKNHRKTFWKYVFVMALLLSYSFTLSAASIVKGTVTDSKSATPLIGVSVVVEGTGTGTITDIDGKFSLNVPSANAVLEFSYVGYTTQKIKVGDLAVMNVLMVEDTKNLEELVVVGYGVQKKSVVTGAISSVRSKDMEGLSILRVEDALKGRTAGVTVTQNSGAPGTSSSVIIRGVTSINGAEPLYVVDGVVLDKGALDLINKSDIESMEVLKDAASAAIYGTASAAGVILITTKKGKAGDIKVSISSNFGIQSPERKLDLLNATEYATLRNEGLKNGGKSLLFSDPASLGEGTDWQKEVFNYSAPIQNHEFSLSGGNEKSTFFSSFGYFDQTGVVASDVSSYKRYTVRLNSDHKVKKWLTIGNTLTYSYTKSKTSVAENDYYGNVLSSAISLDPVTPTIYSDQNVTVPNVYAVKNDDGYYYGLSNYVGQEMINPLAFIQVNKDNYNWANNFNGNVYVQIEPLKGLVFRSSLGGKMAFWGSEKYTPLYYYSSTQMNASQNSYTRGRFQNINYTLSNTISYSRKIDNHNFSVMLGNELRDGSGSGLTTVYSGIPANSLKEASMNVSLVKDNIASWGYEDQPYKLVSYFGRLNYDYMDKYVVNAIVRRDGSSRFGSNNAFGNFPSASVRWNVQNEDFWKQNNYVDALSVRLGYGVNGKDVHLPFKYTSVMQNVGGATFGNDQVYFGSTPASPANPDLRWERTTQINLGVDAVLFGGLSATLDLYQKSTSDMIMEKKLPGYVGATNNPQANMATMVGKGIEFSLTYNKNINKDLSVSATGNIAYNVNEITDIGENDFITIANMQASKYEVERMMKGKPYGMFWGFRTDGIFQTQQEIDSYLNADGDMIQPNAQPGDFRWKDLDGDGKITDKDRENLGLSIPPVTYGITLKANYKNFDVTIFGQGVAGNKICNQIRRLDVETSNYTTAALGRWVGAGTSNTHPRLIEGEDVNENYVKMSDFYLEDGAFFRLRTFQIGYSLPKMTLKNIGIEKIRLSASCNNMFTLTKYNGYNPEIGGSQGIYGIDRGVYPQARSFMFGIDVAF